MMSVLSPSNGYIDLCFRRKKDARIVARALSGHAVAVVIKEKGRNGARVRVWAGLQELVELLGLPYLLARRTQ